LSGHIADLNTKHFYGSIPLTNILGSIGIYLGGSK